MEARRRAYFSIDTEDRPGELFRFSVKMKEAGVNLSALWAFGQGHGHAKIFAIADDLDKLRAALKGAGYAGKQHSCFELTGDDKIGVLCETLDKVEGQSINLHAVDAVAVGGRCVCYLWSAQTDVEAIGKLLGC
jgi:hypothetical protein